MAAKKTTAPMERHTTIAGETLEYARPGPDLAAFLARVRTAADDPRVSEHALVELIYGSENPILDHTIFRGRGAVTRETFANPVYHVMLDLLDAKRVQVGTLDPDRAAQRYTMTVTEAAGELDMTTSAVRQAIASKKLAAWKKGGVYLLDPHSVATYRDHVKRRGPRPEPALRIRMGNRPGASFRVKAPGLEEVGATKLEDGGRVVEAIVPRFARAAIAFSGKRSNTFLLLEPDAEEHERDFHGTYGVSGRFRIVEKITDPEEARKRFRSFRPE